VVLISSSFLLLFFFFLKIWDLSNPYKREVFDMSSFFVACRLVSQAQNNRELSVVFKDPGMFSLLLPLPVSPSPA